MALSLRDIAGGEWERLGMPRGSADTEAPSALGWEDLVPLLHESLASDARGMLELAVVRLEALEDPRGAAKLLLPVAGELAPAAWLLHQIALQLESVKLLQDWQERTVDRDEAAAAGLEQALLTLLQKQAWVPPEEAQEHPLPAVQGFITDLLLAAQEHWEELAERLLEDREGQQLLVSRLIAAHLLGDRLGRPDRQAELLTAAVEQEPLWTAEVLLELTSRSGDADEHTGASLRRRLEVLNDLGDELMPDAAATVALLSAREPAAMDLPWLDDGAALSAWRRVESLSRRLSLAGDLSRLCQHYLDDARVGPHALRPVLQLRAAELLMAAGAFHEALAALPTDTGSPLLDDLARRHRALGLAWQRDWSGLSLELMQQAFRADRADAERVSLARLATLLAVQDPEQSRRPLRLLDKLREQLPSPRLDSALISAYRRLGDQQRLATLWATLGPFATGAGDDDRMFESLCDLAAGVLQLKLNQPAEALEAFSRAGRHREDDPVIRAGVLLALQQQQRWAEVNQALEDLAGRISSDGAVELLRLAAHLALVRADRPQQAVMLLDRVLEQRPDDLGVIQEAIAIRFRLQRFDEAVELLERAREMVQDSGEMADLHCTRGILLHKLDQPRRAEEAFRAALQLHPLHPASLRGLRRLLVDEGRMEEMPPVLVDLLQLAMDDEDRLRILLDLSSLHRQIWSRRKHPEDADACLRYSGEALELDPASEAAARNMVHIYVKQQRWKDLVERLDIPSPPLAALRGLRKALQEEESWERLAAVCQELAKRSGSDRERMAASLRAGDLQLEQLGNMEQAESCYRWTAEQFPDLIPMQRLANLLRLQNRQHELAEVLERQLTRVEQEPEQIQVLLELGQLLAGPLNRPVEARTRFDQVLVLDPNNRKASLGLEDLMDGVVSQNDLARVLEQLLENSRDRTQVLRMLLRLGGVYRGMEDERSMLRITTRLHHDYADEPDAVGFVERAYQELERFSDLRDLYARRIELLEAQPAHDDQQLADLLLAKGDLELNRLQAVAEASESLIRVIEIRPEDADTLQLLEQILGQAGDWARLVEVFERRANGLTDRQDQVAALRQAARIAQRELHQEAESARLYERILGLDPTDAESFSFLEKKLERMNDSKRLVQLLVDRAERVEGAEAVQRYLLRAAAICVKIADLPRATTIYLQALSLVPESRIALEALARIYESQERWDDLLEITRRQIEQETEAARKAVLLFKCGSVMETQRHDEETARRYYSSAVKASPSCLPALHSLRDLYTRRKDWPKVISTLETEARVWNDAKGRADVLARIAEVHAEHLDDWENALAFYKQAIRTNAQCMPAALALFLTYARHGNYDEAAVWGDVYARRVHLRGSKMQRADFFVSWAEVLRQVGRYEESAQYLVHALEIRPGLTNALYSLLDLCRDSPEAYDFNDAFTELLQEAEKREDTVACGILSTACGVLAEHKSDLDTALHLFEQGLAAGGEQIRLVRPLADLLVFLGREEDALELVSRCEERARDDQGEDWAAAKLWLADHQLLWTRDYAATVSHCIEVLERMPERHDVRLRLARAEMMRNRSDVARTEYGRICEQLQHLDTDEDVLARRYHALGLAACRLGDAEGAVDAFKRAGKMAPGWPYPGIGLARGFAQRGHWQEAEQELQRATQQCDGQGRTDVLRASAAFHLTQGNLERAAELMREAVSHSDSDPGDLVQLARVLMQAGRPEQSVTLLRQAIAHTGDHLPAIESLQRAWLSLGNSTLARRGAQVISLASGKRTIIEPPPLSWRPLNRGIWNQLMEVLLPQPLDTIFGLLRRPLEQRYAVAAPPSTEITVEEVKDAFAQMSRYFGVRLELTRLGELGPVFRLHGQRLVLSPQASQLELAELRQVMAMGLAAARSGHGLLLSIGPGHRRELGRLLASFLVLGEPRPAEAEELLVELSRRDRRQLNKLAEQTPLSPAEAAGAAAAWVAAVESMCVRVALLATDDILSLAKVLALQVGISPSWTFRGGLLAAVPELQHLVHYYLSDEFHQSRMVMLG